MLVHGTGVRQPAYDVALERFAANVARIRPGYAVAGCYWGGTHGSRLNANGISIPSGGSYRGLDDPILSSTVDEEAVIALWGLLERDPLFELRLLSTGAMPREELAPNAQTPGRELALKAWRLPASASVMSRAADACLDCVFVHAVEAVLSHAVVTEALRQEFALGDALRTALARAIVAEALVRADNELDGSLQLDGAHRDGLVAAIVAELGGSDRSVGASLGRVGLNVALALGASRALERRRSAITEASAPAAGDVLMYLARGDSIRNFIADMVNAVDGAVVLLAHSLGGVACMESLATRTLTSVELLVTVGSQAPLLYELNALPTLAYGDDLPGTVPRWVNIFDRRDLLAYTGAGLFPGRIEDREVDNRTPFPRSHSAYFANERFYSILDEILP